METEELKKEAEYILVIKAVYGAMKQAKDAHPEIDYAGLQTSIAKRIGKVVLDLTDKACQHQRKIDAEVLDKDYVIFVRPAANVVAWTAETKDGLYHSLQEVQAVAAIEGGKE